MSEVDKWIEIAKQCKYLPENDLKVRIFYHFREVIQLYMKHL